MVEQVRQAKYPSAMAGHRAGSDSPDTFDFYENIGGGMPSPSEVPGTQVVGEVSSTPTQEFEFDAGSGTEVIGLRLSINGSSGTVDAGRLKRAGVGGIAVYNETIRVIHSDTAITRVAFHGITVGSNSFGSASGNDIGCLSRDETSEATVESNLNVLTFDSADNVKTLIVDMHGVFASGRRAFAYIWGVSHD